MSAMLSRHVLVDGIRTHYLEAGDGDEIVVLLHGGAYGEDAYLSWERNIPALAARYRVISPDWLGFGGTDKMRDFVSGSSRMLNHMSRFLDVLCIERAHFGGLSMGGTMLLRVLAQSPDRWPAASAFVASGGGFAPANEARKVLQEYDQTLEGMRALVRASYASPSFAEDDDFVRRRWQNSLQPGAWEATASARFKAPATPPRTEFGNPDDIPYENIRVPVLFTAGTDDELREPGYVHDIAARTPLGRAVEFEDCGHVVNVESPEKWNHIVLQFLSEQSSIHPPKDLHP